MCVGSDGVDEYAINKLLSHIFSNEVHLPGNICSLIKDSASQKFDMKEEVLMYLHLSISIFSISCASHYCLIYLQYFILFFIRVKGVLLLH